MNNSVSSYETSHHNQHTSLFERASTKRRRVSSPDDIDKAPIKRIAACQSCRVKKIKCDKTKPRCIVCGVTGGDCIYQENASDKLTLETATESVLRRIDVLHEQVQSLNEQVIRSNTSQHIPAVDKQTSPSAATAKVIEPSRDFSHIPTCRTSADAVLRWDIFEGRYPASTLIGPLLRPATASTTPNPAEVSSHIPARLHEIQNVVDVTTIPLLVDAFLQNVHTKNPILDVDSLVSHAQDISVSELRTDAWSCLVLLACALGSVAKPFNLAAPLATEITYTAIYLAEAASSTAVFKDELEQAEAFFVEATRRMGFLGHTVLAAQCHFYAGVYLMYTLRPISSWQSFYQASITYQLYLKVSYGVTEPDAFNISSDELYALERKRRRLEESLYWSCFKSECEFRVELPLPQSEIALLEYPHLFPSPPSPVRVETVEIADAHPDVETREFVNNEAPPLRISTGVRSSGTARPTKRLWNEEESWYYYLTEIALRRIGNRIINSFFRQSPQTWLNIKPLLRIALEFDAQVSSWSAHLPAAMKHWETTSSIRAPNFEASHEGETNFVSRELSWATENRLLEMRSWLYQPFLYYLIHHPSQQSDRLLREEIDFIRHGNDAHDTQELSYATYTHAHKAPGERLDSEDTAILMRLIDSGIECNLKILEVRSLRHRHHGLWYDLRSMSCAALVLFAIVKSGHVDRIPGGVDALWVPHQDEENALPKPPLGRLNHMLKQFEFWSSECPHLRQDMALLEEIAQRSCGKK